MSKLSKENNEMLKVAQIIEKFERQYKSHLSGCGVAWGVGDKTKNETPCLKVFAFSEESLREEFLKKLKGSLPFDFEGFPVVVEWYPKISIHRQ